MKKRILIKRGKALLNKLCNQSRCPVLTGGEVRIFVRACYKYGNSWTLPCVPLTYMENTNPSRTYIIKLFDEGYVFPEIKVFNPDSWDKEEDPLIFSDHLFISEFNYEDDEY